MPSNTIDQGVSYIRLGKFIDPIGRLFDPGTLERWTPGSRPFVDRERKLYPEDLRGNLLVLNNHGCAACHLSLARPNICRAMDRGPFPIYHLSVGLGAQTR